MSLLRLEVWAVAAAIVVTIFGSYGPLAKLWQVELIGRRPRDYFEYLPKPIRMRVIDRIRRAYLGHFPSLGADLTQEACARLLASGADLRSGPEPTAVPTQAWYDEAESALVRFATGRVMRQSVLRHHMYFGAPALHGIAKIAKPTGSKL
jgi:hypothetical protein